ncbi:MAG: hypothetical protein ACPGQL_07790 [Thermoplasmatota archaeon]
MRVWALAVAAIVLSGCAGFEQQSVSNTDNNFSYAGQVAGKSETETYDWKNSFSRAQVSWGGQSASGSFTVTIKDSLGNQVYSETFSGTQQGGGNMQTERGTPGTWEVKITFRDFTGQMGLAVQASN